MCNCKKNNIENMTNMTNITDNRNYISKLVHLYTRDNGIFLNEGSWNYEYFKSLNIDNIDIISIPPGTQFYLETYEPVCPKCNLIYDITVPINQTFYYTIIFDINFKLKINNIKNISIKSI